MNKEISTTEESGEESKSTDEPKSENAVETSKVASQEDSAKTPAYVIIVGIVLTLLVIVCLQVDDWSRDWTTNFAETSEEASDVNLQPVTTDLSPEKLADLVAGRMESATRWTVKESRKLDDGSFEIELIHKTFLLGFKDDVKVTIRAVDSGSRLTVTSQSRIGKGDLGQNPRNIKELVSLVRTRLAETENKND